MSKRKQQQDTDIMDVIAAPISMDPIVVAEDPGLEDQGGNASLLLELSKFVERVAAEGVESDYERAMLSGAEVMFGQMAAACKKVSKSAAAVTDAVVEEIDDAVLPNVGGAGELTSAGAAKKKTTKKKTTKTSKTAKKKKPTTKKTTKRKTSTKKKATKKKATKKKTTKKSATKKKKTATKRKSTRKTTTKKRSAPKKSTKKRSRKKRS